MLDEIRRIQLEHARELLTQTDLKSRSIADRCGFGDFRNFSKQFRTHEGPAQPLPPAAAAGVSARRVISSLDPSLPRTQSGSSSAAAAVGTRAGSRFPVGELPVKRDV